VASGRPVRWVHATPARCPPAAAAAGLLEGAPAGCPRPGPSKSGWEAHQIPKRHRLTYAGSWHSVDPLPERAAVPGCCALSCALEWTLTDLPEPRAAADTGTPVAVASPASCAGLALGGAALVAGAVGRDDIARGIGVTGFAADGLGASCALSNDVHGCTGPGG